MRNAYATSATAADRPVDNTELDRAQWSTHLAALSQECAGLQTAVMRGGAARAGPPGAVVLRRLRDIRFDDDADLLTMALGGGARCGPELRCYIEHPRRICAIESADAQSLLITERCGVEIRVVFPPTRRTVDPAVAVWPRCEGPAS